MPYRNADDGAYSVHVWNMHGEHEPVVRSVNDRIALYTAHATLMTVGAKLGLTKRVAIVDDDDVVLLDWRYPGKFIRPKLRP